MPFNSLSDISAVNLDKRVFRADESLPLPTNKVGIEIEMEEATSPSQEVMDTGYWHTEQDHSLRGCAVELISVPIFGKDIRLALELIQDYYNNRPTKPEFSERTSVHIHLECIDLSPEQLVKYLLLYTTLERVLFSFVAEHRRENIYCLPFYLSEGVKDRMVQLINKLQKHNAQQAIRSINQWPKYSAMNIRNIGNIGTIEFRMLDGTIDAERIITWIKILMSIKKYAKEQMQSIDDFPKIVSGYSPFNYLEEVFGSELAQNWLNDIDLEDNLLKGVRTAQDVIIQASLDKSTKAIRNKHKDYTKSTLFKLYPEKEEKILSIVCPERFHEDCMEVHELGDGDLGAGPDWTTAPPIFTNNTTF